MRTALLAVLIFLVSGCAAMQMGGPTVSILVDLDPASTDRTVIVESITADTAGALVFPRPGTGKYPTR